MLYSLHAVDQQNKFITNKQHKLKTENTLNVLVIVPSHLQGGSVLKDEHSIVIHHEAYSSALLSVCLVLILPGDG